MAKFKNDNIYLSENQKLIFGDNDASFHWNGVEMVITGVTISGAEGPPGPPGQGLDNNQIANNDSTTVVRCDDQGFVTVTVSSGVVGRWCADGGLVVGEPSYTSEALIEARKNNADAVIGASVYDSLTPENAAKVRLFKGRGVDGIPEPVVDDDTIGEVEFHTVTDSIGGTGKGASIRCAVDGPVSEDVVPTRLEFLTTENTPANAAVALSISSGGFVKLKDGVSVDEISADHTLAAGSDQIIPTQGAVRTYVDGKVAEVTTSGINYWEIHDQSSIGHQVEVQADGISFKLASVEKMRLNDDGYLTLASGVGINNISTDIAFTYADNYSVPTTAAVLGLVATISGGGGLHGATSLETDDELASLILQTEQITLRLDNNLHHVHTTNASNYYSSSVVATDVRYRNPYLYNVLNDYSAVKFKLEGYSSFVNSKGIGWLTNPLEIGQYDTDHTPTLVLTRGRRPVSDPDDTVNAPMLRDYDVMGSLDFRHTTTEGGGQKHSTNARIMAMVDSKYGVFGQVNRTYGELNPLTGLPYDDELTIQNWYMPTGLAFYTNPDSGTTGLRQAGGSPVPLKGLQLAMYLTPDGYMKLSHPSTAKVNYFVPSSARSTQGENWTVDTQVPTLGKVTEMIEYELSQLGTQDHTFNSIHSDTSGYNANLASLSMGSGIMTLNFNEGKFDTSADDGGKHVLSGQAWTGRTAVDEYATQATAGTSLFNKNKTRTNFYIENFSTHYSTSFQGGWLTFHRGHGWHPEVKLPMQGDDIIGGLSARGVCSKTGWNVTTCQDRWGGFKEGSRMFFLYKGEEGPGNRPKVDVYFQTGLKRDTDNLPGGGDLYTRMIMHNTGKIVMGEDLGYEMGDAGNLGRVQMLYRVNDILPGTQETDLFVMELGNVTPGIGGSIGLGGNTGNGGERVTFAKIVGSKDNASFTNNGGRFSIWVKADKSIGVRECMRVNAQFKTSFGVTGLGQEFNASYGRLQLNQTNDNPDNQGFAVLNGSGTQAFQVWSSNLSARMENPLGNKWITMASDGGCVNIGSDGNTAIEAKLVVNGNIAPKLDNSYDLGTITYRWDDLYATNGAIQTSDRNQKEEIARTTLGLGFINALKPVSYKFKGGKRKHQGLIAQDVEELINKKGIDSKDFAALIKDGDTYGLRYTEFIAPLIKAVQELSEQNGRLTKRLEALEG